MRSRARGRTIRSSAKKGRGLTATRESVGSSIHWTEPPTLFIVTLFIRSQLELKLRVGGPYVWFTTLFTTSVIQVYSVIARHVMRLRLQRPPLRRSNKH